MKIRALHDKYYLDKHFFPLKEKLLNMLAVDSHYSSIDKELLEDIVYDILGTLKPTYKQVKEKPIRLMNE